MNKYCNSCGAAVPETYKFCSNCGADMNVGEAVMEAETVEVIIEPPRKSGSAAYQFFNLRERLIGDKAAFYLSKFDLLEQTNSFFNWNWAAFLFGPAWMMYRKLYVFAIGFWLIGVIVGLLEFFPATILLMAVYGGLSNYLYMKDIDRRMQRASDFDGEAQDAFVAKFGGTSWVAVFVYYAMIMAVNSILLS